jgi:hypothetical protein
MVVLPVIAFALFAALIGGCASAAPSSGGPGAALPEAAAERFLRLAAEGDYAGMGMLFGTADGAVGLRDPAPEVERRMYALATLVRHESASVGGGTPVPGRTGQAVAFEVELTRGGSVRNLGVVTVLGPGSRWYVEQVEVRTLAGRGP